MTRIDRQPEQASRESYDLVVIGGGIYGVCAALESAKLGMQTLLLEKNDFGSATSFNSLRILHGGLRYLQHAELKRFRESVRERRWFLQTLPELCRPLRCLMPLYGKGMRRGPIFRIALAINDLLSRDRNRGVPESGWLRRGQLLSRAELIEQAPLIDADGLRDVAQWYDGVMMGSERVQMELHRWAAAAGVTQLNYVGATGFRMQGGEVQAVEAYDSVAEQPLEFECAAVLNCAGAWCREVAGWAGKDSPWLYPRSLAFNLLLNVEPIAGDAAVAVEPKYEGAQTYFLVPYKGRMHAGTYHLAWDGRDNDEHTAPEAAIEKFLSDLNDAVPGWGLTRDDVMHVYSGQLPAIEHGKAEMSHIARFMDHGGGLFSLAGHKYTTARCEAEKAVRKVRDALGAGVTGGPAGLPPRPASVDPLPLCDARDLIGHPDAANLLQRLADEESVIYLEDLIDRRLDGIAEADVRRQLVELGERVMAERDVPVGGLA